MNNKLLSRFWSKVFKTEDCWIWTASKFKDGYGQIKINKKNVKAHRFSYELHFGPAGDLLVCHKCDNPSCVKPSHLFLGTPKDNSKDRNLKGRQSRGTAVNTNKLTVEAVVEIRNKYATGNFTQKQLAKEYEIAQTGISGIILRKTWKHV